MKYFLLFPAILFLGACSDAKEDPKPVDPALVEHTVEVKYRARYSSRYTTTNGQVVSTPLTSAHLRPSLSVDLVTTSGVDYALSPWEYQPDDINPGVTTVRVGTYKGVETITLEIALPGQQQYRTSDYPAQYSLTASLWVDGKLQNQSVTIQTGNGNLWNASRQAYVWTLPLRSSDVVK